MGLILEYDAEGRLVSEVEVPDEQVEPTEADLLRADLDQALATIDALTAAVIERTDITADDIAQRRDTAAAAKGRT